MNNAWIDKDEIIALENEYLDISKKFRNFIATDDGREIVRILFKVFSSPPNSSSTEKDFMRHVGRMDVLNFIIHRSKILERNDDGK
jgi:hypothetical protein